MKRNKFMSDIFAQQAGSLGFKHHYIYLALIVMTVAILGLVYGYRVLIRSLEIELKPEASTPENYVLPGKETDDEQLSREKMLSKQHGDELRGQNTG